MRFLNGLLGSKWIPIIFQVMMLLVFGLLIHGGLGVTTNDATFAKVLRNTNLANLIVWSYWWPMVIVSAIVLGRVWCLACPMELVTSLASRFGLRRPAPAIFKSGWVVTIFFAAILLVGIHMLAIHRIPHRMSLYMIVLLGAALVTGLVFEKRAFCSYVCPVGHLLGLYAHCSGLFLGVADKETCKSCPTKDCVSKDNLYNVTGHSCTSNLYPPALKHNRDCLLCSQCRSACPYDNPGLSWKRPFADFFGNLDLKPAQAAFVALMSGFVAYEVISEWKPSKAVLTWVPGRVTDALGVSGTASGFVSALIMFVVFPAVLFLAVAAVARLLSGERVTDFYSTFALVLIPTMAGAHVIKAILKMTSRIPYWSHVFSDPIGINTAGAIVDKSLVLDKSIPDSLYPVTTFIAVAALLTALLVTGLIFRRSPFMARQKPGPRLVMLAGVIAYWGAFGLTIFLWRLC